MALHILNFSIDSPDAQPDEVPENLALNDIESVAELVLEQLMGFDNVIAEHDEHDTEDGGSLSVAKILFFFQSVVYFNIKDIVTPISSVTSNSFYTDSYALQFHPEIVPPPPQRV
jgi:hypothetical protein